MTDQTAVLDKIFTAHSVGAHVVKVTTGPTTVLYSVELRDGVRPEEVLRLAETIKMRTAATSVRILSPVPGESVMGIELPRADRQTVLLKDVPLDGGHPLTVPLGIDTAGHPQTRNLATMPHWIVAGATGSGKSVYINDVIVSLINRCGPEVMRLVLVDPKEVELAAYADVPHLACPIVTDPDDAVDTLQWLCDEMDRRYSLLRAHKVRELTAYNRAVSDALTLPYLVVIVDELAGLMARARKEIEPLIVRLAGKARAAGIHMVLATQRPSVDVVTGLIKDNVPSRLAFAVPSHTASGVILNRSGAQHLLGQGDALYMAQDVGDPLRVQTPYTSDEDIEAAVLAAQERYPDTAYLWPQEEDAEEVSQLPVWLPPQSDVPCERPAARAMQVLRQVAEDPQTVTLSHGWIAALVMFWVVIGLAFLIVVIGQHTQPESNSTVVVATP